MGKELTRGLGGGCNSPISDCSECSEVWSAQLDVWTRSVRAERNLRAATVLQGIVEIER